MNQTRQSTDRQIRVFISSTFRDMHAERDHLVTVVFPELRERVERLGLEFFDVDLRWGVPAKDLNGETANSWEYCRQWIDRVEPFFVCILGQRYGWVPEPRHFRDSADRQRQQREPRSITDLEVRHAVLDTRAKRRSYFYLRATPVPQPNAEYVDPPEYQDRLEQLKTAVRNCGRPVRNYSPAWTGQGFLGLKEFGDFVLDDLWSGVLRDERYVPKAVWRHVLNADPDTDPRYTDESQPVPRELWEKIVALAKPPPQDPLDAERQQMEAFAATRLRWFQGRTRELQQLTDFIHSTAENAPRLALVAAAPGQGKSALLAKLWQELSAVSGQPSAFVVAHFVGATERSATAHALVQRLLDELDRSGIEWPADEQKEGEEPNRDFNSLCNRLRQRLGDYAGDRRIVILLDALNQLTDGHNLAWLPHRLGPSVRIVVSCVDCPSPAEEREGGRRPGEGSVSNELRSSRRGSAPSASHDSQSQLTSAATPEQQVLETLERWKNTSLRVRLGELSPEDVRTIVVEFLKEYCKELDREQVGAICRMDQAKNPLYLLVMLGELRTLGGNDMNRIVGELITALPHDFPDTVALFRWVLQRLEVFGQEAVRWWCLYLAHGRLGMASQELADLLACKLGTNTAPTALLIQRGLRRYLLRRGGQLDFFHSQLRTAVFEQFSGSTNSVTVRTDLASYFRRQDDFLETVEEQRARCRRLPATPRVVNIRKAEELLYQELKILGTHGVTAVDFDTACTQIEDLLTDLSLLESKAEAGLVYELRSEFMEAIHAIPERRPRRPMLCRLEEALRRDLHFIARHPTTLFQCLYNSCYWLDAPEPAQSPDECGPATCVDAKASKSSNVTVRELVQMWRGLKDLATPEFSWLRKIAPQETAFACTPPQILSWADMPLNGIQLFEDHNRENPNLLLLASSAFRSVALGSGRVSEVQFSPAGDVPLIFSGTSQGRVSPDGQLLVLITCKLMHIYQTATWLLLATVPLEHMVSTGPVFSADNHRFVLGYDSGEVEVRFADTGLLESTYSCGHCVRQVSLGRQGVLAVTGPNRSADSLPVNLLHPDTNPPDVLVDCSRGQSIMALPILDAWLDNWRRFFVISDGDHAIWQQEDTLIYGGIPRGNIILRCRFEEIAAVAYASAKGSVVIGSRNGAVHLWAPAELSEPIRIGRHHDSISHVAVSPSGTTVAAASGSGVVYVWSGLDQPVKGAAMNRPQYPRFERVEMSPDGSVCLLLPAFVDGKGYCAAAKLVSTESGNEIADIGTCDFGVFSNDGNLLVTWNEYDSVWRRHQWHCWICRQRGLAAISNESELVAVVGPFDYKAWDVQSGRLLATLHGGGGFFRFGIDLGHGIELPPPVRPHVNVWRTSDWTSLATYKGHETEGELRSLKFSADGLRVVSHASSTRIWESATGSEIEESAAYQTSDQGVRTRPLCLRVRRGDTCICRCRQGGELGAWVNQADAEARFGGSLHPSSKRDSSECSEAIAWWPFPARAGHGDSQGRKWVVLLGGDVIVFCLEGWAGGAVS